MSGKGLDNIVNKLNQIINELNEEGDQLQSECDEKSGVRTFEKKMFARAAAG
jgi:hypothetical protein